VSSFFEISVIKRVYCGFSELSFKKVILKATKYQIRAFLCVRALTKLPTFWVSIFTRDVGNALKPGFQERVWDNKKNL
jgi:hypothetical protein